MNTIVKHTVGFIASIVLTLLAVFVTLYTNMTFHAKVTIIFGFAFIQAALQLLMFMHLTEGKDGRLQSFKVIFAIIITLHFHLICKEPETFKSQALFIS
ncbi:MAG: cytochrome aa3 quinol oxidase subunit IV [Staphylococcus epidermidis]|nr:cytochrome aa3 quinol oxidase subunit IV [Staphylococcus epidermidis]